ncbi:MAG: isoprenyl transferase [Desulfuromonadales bacterium]|nr:isoprenyl transferase [Desulfuromonadales bacterium]
MSVPKHLAIIMDGNGRWAEQRRLPRIFGHRKGVQAVRPVVDECLHRGVEILTLYAFSSENWGRPREEVTALMELLGSFLKKELPQLQKRQIRLKTIGEVERLPAEVATTLHEIVAQTADNRGLTLCLALSYGGRDELVRAVRRIAAEVAAGKRAAAEIDEAIIDASLDTAGLPDPDLLIRTSGEYRISNFLLWQLAYTELIFTDVLWPDFSPDHLQQAFAEFGRRQRRFGLTAGQLKGF